MATAKNAKLMREAGQDLFDYTAATDSGDHTIYTVSGKTVFSAKSAYVATVRPNGIVSGRNVLSTHASNDTVTVAAFTAYSGGTLYSVSATTASITRAASDVAQIHSITMNSSGAIAVVEGEDSGDSTLVETRGAAGGPPSIPADSVEIGQVRLTGNTAAVISASEIKQVVGTHTERYDYPTWSVNCIGDGDNASVSAKENAYIKFDSAHPMIHGSVATDAADSYKKTYVTGYTPSFTEITKCLDFTPAQNTHSVTSTQIYNGTVGSTSSSLGQGGFTAMLSDGITDGIMTDEDETITFKFYPDRNKAPYSLTQGILGISSQFPAGDQIKAECTISAEDKTANFSS